jgi:hypothetical protein
MEGKEVVNTCFIGPSLLLTRHLIALFRNDGCLQLGTITHKNVIMSSLSSESKVHLTAPFCSEVGNIQ